MPTVHYVSRALLQANGLYRLHKNDDGNDDDLGVAPRTMDTGNNSSSSTLTESRPNSDSTVNNGQKKKRNSRVSFNDSFEDLKAYKEKYGHVNVSRKTDKSHFNWCINIRSARNKPGEGKLKLPANRIAALDAIGFDWRSEGISHTREKTILFQDRVAALRQYKEKHGHLSVTFKANESLYYRCANIRNARRGKVGKCKIKLTQERIAALDAIGFDWRWSKSVSQPFNSLVDDADKASGKSEESCFCYDRKR